MAAGILTSSIEPLVELDNLGASLDMINRLTMPISEPILRGVQYGETQSLVRGQGAERDGMRDYVIGDDPRYIDWSATARRADGIPKLRQHLKDVTPNLWLVTDLAKKNWRITSGQNTAQRLGLSAVLAMQLLAERESMPSGTLAISDFERFETRATELSRDHILHAGRKITSLVEAEPKPASDNERQRLGNLLKRLGVVANESLVVVVSDFRDVASPSQANGWKRPLQQLKAQGNDIIAIEVNNPDQTSMKLVETPALDTGVVHLGFGRERRKIDAEYAKLAKQNQQEIDAALKSVGAAHIKLSADEPKWFTSLRSQLARAAQRANR